VVLFRTPPARWPRWKTAAATRNCRCPAARVEERGLRCGYHGLLFAAERRLHRDPRPDRKIPIKARVKSFRWSSATRSSGSGWPQPDGKAGGQPDAPPRYPVHADPRYRFKGGDVFHYDAPYQLIHDNLLDLSHLGYVHTKDHRRQCPACT
jgi:phenylpropionate dioxygenase-like ring-hydroxylating dioxygenase large terminal subunit